MSFLDSLRLDRPACRPGSWSAYGVATALVVLATALRLVLAPWLVGVQFITFFPAIIGTSLLCGPAAGAVALILSTMAAWYFVLPAELLVQEICGLALFVAVATIDVAIIGGLQQAAARVRELNDDLKSSEAKFRGLLASAPDAIVIVDAHARIVLVNAQTEALFGYDRTELLGQPVETLVPLRSRINHSKLVGGFMAQPRTAPMGLGRELSGCRKDGTEFPIEVSLSPHLADHETLVFSAIRDITARRQVIADLEEARLKEQAANRAKSEFLSNMSHELRTPLNAVLGFGQMLELDPEKSLSGKYREYVGYILTAGRHLLSLIDEVLDLSGIESGRLKLAFERVTVSDAVEEVRAIVGPMAQAANVRLEVSVPEGIDDVVADPVRLQQGLLNLVANGVKYNRPGGGVTLTVRAIPADRLRFEVTDTGIGITPQRQRELFQPFQRLGAERSRVEGFGIGLAVSRKLIEAMNGTIGCISTPDVGSTFWIELPAAAADARVPIAIPTDAA